jgi:hypothetical protein
LYLDAASYFGGKDYSYLKELTFAGMWFFPTGRGNCDVPHLFDFHNPTRSTSKVATALP